MNYNPEEYDPVDSRIKQFYRDHPLSVGGIQTVLHSDPNNIDFALFEAQIFIHGVMVANGWAQEIKDAELKKARSGKEYESVNYTSWLENAETSAIGRALANAGYSGNKRASLEEMEKAKRKTDSKEGNGEQKKSDKTGKRKTESGTKTDSEPTVVLDVEISKKLTGLLDKAIASGDAQLKKEAEGAKKSMKNIKDKKSLQNFLNLWKKKLSGMDLTASKDQPKDSTDMTPEEVAEAVQGELVDPKDPGASEAFDA